MKYWTLIKDNTGVAGVIEAILLIGLISVVLGLIQLTYIPDIMEDREADHMDQVLNQFSQLKSTIEIQSTMGIINEDNAPIRLSTYTYISSPITMGSRELPYFVSSRSYGQVQLIDRYRTKNYEIDVQPAPAYFPTGIPLTSVKYNAMNYYFTRQDYILEGGGVILVQPDGETMKIQPAMNIVNYTNEIEINWLIPLFKGVSGKNLTAGYKECYISTNYTTYYEDQKLLTQANGGYLRITTEHPEAWNLSLIDESGLLKEYFDNDYIDVVLNDAVTPNRVEITPSLKDINLKITIVEIGVQIGAGRIIESG
jgi:hypothetical protein